MCVCMMCDDENTLCCMCNATFWRTTPVYVCVLYRGINWGHTPLNGVCMFFLACPSSNGVCMFFLAYPSLNGAVYRCKVGHPPLLTIYGVFFSVYVSGFDSISSRKCRAHTVYRLNFPDALRTLCTGREPSSRCRLALFFSSR